MRFWVNRRALAALAMLVCAVALAAGAPLRAQQHEPPPSDPPLRAPDSQPSPQSLPDAIQPRAAERLTMDDRFHLYLRSFTNVTSVLGPAAGAGIGQWRDEPPEWNQGAEGYGRRFASGYARLFISQTIRFGVAAADGEDPRFEPSNESGIWRRTRHALAGNFVSHTESGARIPAFSRFAGPYGAAFIANTWYPASRADSTHALERGSTAFASSVGWSVFHEFWPDIRRELHLGPQ